jgi:hypothetical protein
MDGVSLKTPELVPVPGDYLVASAMPETGRDMLTLSLDDLVPDARGKIVIVSDGDHDITVVTDQTVASTGVEPSQPHLTETGLDVSGFSYCTFASGVTVFCPSAHRLLVLNEA